MTNPAGELFYLQYESKAEKTNNFLTVVKIHKFFAKIWLQFFSIA